MRKQSTASELDFEIDELTNSIKNRLTCEEFPTDVSKLSHSDLTLLKKESKKWHFDWSLENKTENRFVRKLTTIDNPTIIHGIISYSDLKDHVFMHLIENARFNIGENKAYMGVAGNLVAHCCKESLELGYDGVVLFLAKTRLIDHYKKSLNAKQFIGNKMIIESKFSLNLVHKYFKDYR